MNSSRVTDDDILTQQMVINNIAVVSLFHDVFFTRLFKSGRNVLLNWVALNVHGNYLKGVLSDFLISYVLINTLSIYLLKDELCERNLLHDARFSEN